MISEVYTIQILNMAPNLPDTMFYIKIDLY